MTDKNMNTALLSRLSRVVRDTGYIATAAGCSAEKPQTQPTAFVRNRQGEDSAHPSRFAPKATLDQFVTMLANSPEPMTFTAASKQAKSELDVSQSTAHRLLKDGLLSGRIKRIEDCDGNCTYIATGAEKKARTKVAAMVAERAPTISQPAKKAKAKPGLVTLSVELTPAQLREFRMWAAANNCDVGVALHVLAAQRLETVCRANIEWDDELVFFKEAHHDYVKRRISVLKAEQESGHQARDDRERVEILKLYEPRDN